ncbi:hypothetical protein [Xanthomarina sp. F2636L]|uniref:hypothetical protein n=1 Tax=Xanthomarina sp. F2636L TaxID=2996018 RepID=UPI00225E06C9|nr:hypothetical protein [Xanthomarina sp. F2636L]MCX7549267.1 hypothetical protein [Xanthomarina sp. F2636L]
MNTEENRELSDEEFNSAIDKTFNTLDKRSAIIYVLMKAGLVINDLSKMGYKIDLTQKGIKEILNVKLEDIDSLSFSCRGLPSFE